MTTHQPLPRPEVDPCTCGHGESAHYTAGRACLVAGCKQKCGQAAVEPAAGAGPTVHVLKTWPPYFADILAGLKTFEVRTDDRGGYKVGDTLHLVEWDPDAPHYPTGRDLDVTVTYVLSLRAFGYPELVAMGVSLVPDNKATPEPEVSDATLTEWANGTHTLAMVPRLIAAVRGSRAQALGDAGPPTEGICDECRGPNPVWFVANEVWNTIVGNPHGFLCPRCFAMRGPEGRIWRLTVAESRLEPDSGGHGDLASELAEARSGRDEWAAVSASSEDNLRIARAALATAHADRDRWRAKAGHWNSANEAFHRAHAAIDTERNNAAQAATDAQREVLAVREELARVTASRAGFGATGITFEHDPGTAEAYIHLPPAGRNAVVTREVGGLNIDIDRRGNAVGIEILNLATKPGPCCDKPTPARIKTPAVIYCNNCGLPCTEKEPEPSPEAQVIARYLADGDDPESHYGRASDLLGLLHDAGLEIRPRGDA